LKSKNETLRELREVPLFLGIGYRHFLMILSGFVDMGVLEKNEEGYRIKDYEALQELAKDRYLI
jgi:hypothetical protein